MRMQRLAGYQLFAARATRSQRCLLVTAQCRNRQSRQQAVYIDCKLQRLDCALDELYKLPRVPQNQGATTEMATASGNNAERWHAVAKSCRRNTFHCR